MTASHRAHDGWTDGDCRIGEPGARDEDNMRTRDYKGLITACTQETVVALLRWLPLGDCGSIGWGNGDCAIERNARSIGRNCAKAECGSDQDYYLKDDLHGE